MLKNFVKNSFWIAIAFFCAQTSYAQGNGPSVENPFPASSALLNIAPDADGHLTLAGEYKQAKNVIEPEKPVFWTWYFDAGYESQYNFRGTNLTPDADGAGDHRRVFRYLREPDSDSSPADPLGNLRTRGPENPRT